MPAACRASVRPLLPECLLGSREHARGWSLSHGSHVPPESLPAEEGGAKWTSGPPPTRIVLLEGQGWGRAGVPGLEARAGLGSSCFPGMSLVPSGEDRSLLIAVRGCPTPPLWEGGC